MTGVPVTEDSAQGSLRPLPGDGHAVTIVALPASALIPLREQLVAVAAQAFGAAPWHERPIDAVRVVDRMWCRLGRRGFSAVAALDGPHLAGFTYGHVDTVCAALDPATAAVYDAFEVVELAVATAYQRRGVGRKLHDALLADAAGPRFLLTHPEALARQRYLAWGWSERGLVTSPVTGQLLVLMHHDPIAVS